MHVCMCSSTLIRELLEVERVSDVTYIIMSEFLETHKTCYDFITITGNGSLEINICQLAN